MPNANENMAPMAQGDAATEPIDLASAFKMLNQANREAAQEPVENGEPDNRGAVGDDNGAPDTSGTGEGAVGYTGEPADNAGDGGSSDGIEAIDFNAYKQQMLRDIQTNAANQVRKEFNEQNIGYYSVAELTQRDENTGQVRFRNPDVQDERNPDYYFKSRTEMQQFVEAWNKGVDFEFRKAVNEKQRELMGQAAPTARMIDFMPKWQAMDDVTKGIFDDLLEGHEIRDANGKEIGFNVDLNAVAAQAERIAKRYSNVPKEQEQGSQGVSEPQKNSEPALDMKTGNGKSEDEKEPTNIGEALRMFDKKNKGGK